MNIKEKAIAITVTLFVSIFVFFAGSYQKVESAPVVLYQVYLNSQKIGLIKNKEEFLNLIDNEQSEIKEKYGVDKVYPPNGLEIKKVYTYNEKIDSVDNVYNKIKNVEPFTINGYKITINYKESTSQEENESEIEKIKKEPKIIYVLKKEIFEDAMLNTIASFIGEETLEKYKNNTQLEITETGTTIENIYWDEDISIKQSHLSTEEFIFSNVEDLSKYLLFGTLEPQQTYTVQAGDDIAQVAFNNNLNTEEFLIANPTFTSANVLLTAGQQVNIGLINPLVTIVHEAEVIEDVSEPFKTVYEDDNTKYKGEETTIQEGSNGLTRVTEKIQYKNGEVQSLYITNKSEITPSVDKIISRGTKKYNTYNPNNYTYSNETGNANWSWPTVTPYIITSPFEYRWGRLHAGIDISGCGHGSPIYAVQSGKVYKVETNRYKNSGLAVYIDHGNGYYTIYMHLSKIMVSEGQTVSRQQQVGQMGCTGDCTGTHLHLGVYMGIPYQGGTPVNPCKSIFSC